MENADLEQAILDFVGRPGYRPVKPRLIARHLHIPKDELPDLKKTIKRLIARGLLSYGPNHLVQPAGKTEAKGAAKIAGQPSPQANRIVGVFRRNDAGYGFVRPTPVAGAETADIYIPAQRSGDASTGDTVAVQLHQQHGDRHPGPRGEVVEIIQRQTNRFVGTYGQRAGTAAVVVDGTLFAAPISVGDPGAHSVQPGDKVVIEMVRFPSHLHDGEGVITEVLGPLGTPGVDTLSILREFSLPEQFPEDVLEDARAEAQAFEEMVEEKVSGTFSRNGPKGAPQKRFLTPFPPRLDATAETVITIDPADARDFDDAISLVRLDNGHWRLGVHIADVAHFVRPRTAVDREARERATSVYLPDRVIPMLPEVISNGLASLQPGKIRLTKSAFLEFTPEGIRVSTELHRAAINSAKRLSYDQVDAYIADPEAWRTKLGAKVHELLGRMRELAAILRRRRVARGALELTMPEVKIEIDKEGRVVGARVVENTESHQIIEEFMLAANEAVAELLCEKGFPFLRRIHESPVPRKLKLFGEFIAELGLPADDVQSRFGLQKLLAGVAGKPQQHAVNYALLRSLQRAVYSPREEGHYALASDCYCHFTSPIRRYPDLTVHRLIDAVLDGAKPRLDFGELVMLGEHCSDREQRAEAAERELTKLKLLAYLETRIGEEMDAVITGVEAFGLFVQGLELPAEGLIHVDGLVDDYYSFDRASHTLAGRRSGNSYRLGDVLRVKVARVDLERRELDFRLVAGQPRAEAIGKRPARPRAAPKGKRNSPRETGKGRKKRR